MRDMVKVVNIVCALSTSHIDVGTSFAGRLTLELDTDKFQCSNYRREAIIIVNQIEIPGHLSQKTSFVQDTGQGLQFWDCPRRSRTVGTYKRK